MQNFIIRITQENDALIANQSIGCFILEETLTPAFAAAFVLKAHQAEKLVLCAGDKAAENYRQYQADGFVVDTVKEVAPQKILKPYREKFPKAIIGAVCRNRRHEAMLVSECEPDFVIFKFWQDGLETNRELLAWYNELFLIQSAAQIEEKIDWRSLSADFLIVSDVVSADFLPSEQ